LGDLHEAELFIVVRADPFAGIERSLLERGIDIAGRELLRDQSELGHNRAGETADAHFQSLEVVGRFDLLAEPAAHLSAGIGRSEANAIEVLEQVVEQLLAAAMAQPGNHLTRIQSERQCRSECERRILSEIVIKRRIAHLDGAIADRIKDLQAGNNFTGGEDLDLEFVVGNFGNALRKIFAAAVQSIERFWPARRKSPLYWRR